MSEISIVGLDLAKQVFQVHAADEAGRCLLRKQLKRREVLSFFAGLAPCVVAMEACGSAHYFAREIAKLGHEARLVPPAYVKPYVKRGKSDRIDAEAICEAAGRPTMRFVPVKTVEQQSLATLHRCRDLLVKNRTMLVNALRAHLAEFGFVAAKGIGKLPEWIEIVSEAPAEALPEMARAPLSGFLDAIALINRRLDDIEKRLRAWHKGNAQSKRLETIPGVGLIGATALCALVQPKASSPPTATSARANLPRISCTRFNSLRVRPIRGKSRARLRRMGRDFPRGVLVPDPKLFKNGRHFAAWIGITPRLDGTGGKIRLGRISKAGDGVLRRLFVLGATALLHTLKNKATPLALWMQGLLARRSKRAAAVALANKLARIAWAIMASGEAFKPLSGGATRKRGRGKGMSGSGLPNDGAVLSALNIAFRAADRGGLRPMLTAAARGALQSSGRDGETPPSRTKKPHDGAAGGVRR